MNLSKFGETLEELMFENNLTRKMLASVLGVSAPTITRYIKGQRLPDIKILIKIADCFNCSVDFLFGLEEYNEKLTFKKCPLFSEQLLILVKYTNLNYEDFYTKLKLPESSFFEWKSGGSVPNLESIQNIAVGLNRRIDFVLGREN